MLAQTNPADALQFLQLLVTLNTIGGVAVAVFTVAAFFSNRKQRREVSFGFIPAAKDEFDKHVAWNQKEHDNLFAKLGGLERGAAAKIQTLSREWRDVLNDKIFELIRSNEESRQKIQENANALAREVGELSAANNLLNQRLAQIDAKLDRLIERQNTL